MAARPLWNPIGQVFFVTFAAAGLAGLSCLRRRPVAVRGGRLRAAAGAGGIDLLSGSFAFESCDVLCQVRWSRPLPRFDPAYRPKVSPHVPAYNEPPNMLIETIRSLDRLDYPTCTW